MSPEEAIAYLKTLPGVGVKTAYGVAMYGLGYFHQLLDTQQRHYRDVKCQLEREIALLKEFGRREGEAHERAFHDVKDSTRT